MPLIPGTEKRNFAGGGRFIQIRLNSLKEFQVVDQEYTALGMLQNMKYLGAAIGFVYGDGDATHCHHRHIRHEPVSGVASHEPHLAPLRDSQGDQALR